jgi:phosphatidate cytidylyltransferase
MLRTRLIVGAILIALTAGMLFLDRYLAPWFPFLLAVVSILSVLGTIELVRLLPEHQRPDEDICVRLVLLLILCNWIPVIVATWSALWRPALPQNVAPVGPSGVSEVFAALVLLAFVVEMARFKAPGGVVVRLALTVFVMAYLGLLPSFLVQLQLGRADHNTTLGALSLALAIFVPKGCDIGAYFTGRLIGRHRMTPVLSPKKTWEGAIGGLVVAVLMALGLNSLGPVIPGGTASVILFGLFVGVTGMLGDLAESLIKRDCQQKDASQTVPGFGGVLDVVDSIVFAAPVCYWGLQ